MSFDKDRPNFYDETVIKPSDFNRIANKINTKVFEQRETVTPTEIEDKPDLLNIRPQRVSLLISPSKAELIFEINKNVFVGRSSRPEQPFDGIDLSPFNGYEFGVSRLHAEFIVQNEKIALIDKRSANGTLLNRQRLEPEIAYILKHGDHIWFGTMQVHIRFLTSTFNI